MFYLSLPSSSNFFNWRSGSRAFTLVEMLVVIGIFTIVTTVVLANLPEFRERTALQLVAQKMAITIREAQVYGVGVKSFGTTSFPSHGIYFYPVSDNNKSYILFADKDNNPSPPDNRFDDPAELVTRYDLTGSITIQGLEICDSVSPCNTSYSNVGFHILFERPRTEAAFTDVNGDPIPDATLAKIILSSGRSGETRTIEVWNTGQISVK